MKRATSKQILMLLLAAMIWGSAFVAQSVGMDYVGPFTFLAIRNYLGAGVLMVYLALGRKASHAPKTDTSKGPADLRLGSLCCGAALFAAAILQQIGIKYTTVGKAGFISSLYVLVVPFLALLLFRRKLPIQIWFCVLLSVMGMYLLCLTGPIGFSFGDLMVLLSAFGFGVQILMVDRFAPLTDPVKLACGEFLVCAMLATLPMLALEHPTLSTLAAAWLPIAYAGVLSSGVAYTLQTMAQSNCDATVCSLIMCLESVFSALFGWLLLGQALSIREISGCLLMFLAIVLSQLPEPRKLTAAHQEAG